jgi:hypothetical protein
MKKERHDKKARKIQWPSIIFLAYCSIQQLKPFVGIVEECPKYSIINNSCFQEFVNFYHHTDEDEKVFQQLEIELKERFEREKQERENNK